MPQCNKMEPDVPVFGIQCKTVTLFAHEFNTKFRKLVRDGLKIETQVLFGRMNDQTSTAVDTELDSQTQPLEGDTPALRLFSLLELITGDNQRVSLQRLVERTGLPKPTLHRMLQQLESAGILQRESDGRHYASGARLRRLAENMLLNDTSHGARHQVLRRLVEEVGETCNITALSGSDVIYLDRVETTEPLRISLHPGSRVPVHCSASGKLFLAQLPPAQRRKLLEAVPLKRYTPKTLTDPAQVLAELDQAQQSGFAVDNEEYLPGLFCVAVLVPAGHGRSNMGIAIQAPTIRLSHDKALAHLPALQRAANALAKLESDEPMDDLRNAAIAAAHAMASFSNGSSNT